MLRTYVLPLVCLLLLSACAPTFLGRTPTPAAPGVRETSLSAGYPFGLTEPPPRGAEYGVDPAYWPVPLPLGLRIAYGRSETLETNLELMTIIASFGARYGVKKRFREAPVELAFDYGGSLYLSNVGVDAGILAAVPLGDAKLYGGLRGFGSYAFGKYLVGGDLGDESLNEFGGAVALTVGSEVPLKASQSVMLELTLLTNLYNGITDCGIFAPEGCVLSSQPVGFSLVPAVTFNF